ncbi:MAG: formyltransferase [Gammaproteobacteria bacterium]|nr:formyltransferase [Gammaproteobacteria bacterium]MDE2250043.1 formyltransferase [Gammaproteobacteria bacterium]
MTRAVVFAYHDVGVRCLRVLLGQGVEVPLVVTHETEAGEPLWFDSVARHARWHGLEVLTPADPNAPALLAKLRALAPDFLFSFYYRHMLGADVLAAAARGAYNMHGSLLPKYRGRVPVNWAVLNGERETGATLHAMTVRPDAGGIVDAQAVPILPDDTAVEVFRKVCVAAELTLQRALPGLVAGTAVLRPQRQAEASYYGRRTAADGAIDWRLGVMAVHNLVRAVAPPYPGAFATAAGLPLRVLRTLPVPGPGGARPELRCVDGEMRALCHDGVLRLLEFELDGRVRDAAAFRAAFGGDALVLGDGRRQDN